MELRLNNLDYIDNVLNRSKFIIDEYNDKLVNENEYAHINIIRDIDKSLIKLNEIKNEYDILNLFIKNFNNQNLIQLEYYITNHTNVENISKIKSILDIPLLSNYSITILTKNDVFNGSCYIIKLEKKMKTIDFHTHLLSKDVSFDRLYDKVALTIFAKSLNANKKLLLNEKYEGYVKTLINNIDTSNNVDKIVLLPVDGIYDNNGYYISKDNTVCSNTHDILELYNKFPNHIVPFLSVNPNRYNSLDLLDEYIERGCKGVKFLQNYWNIDLNDKKYIPYFEKIKKHNLPIVIHTGSEYAVKSNSLFEKIEVSNQAIEIGCNVVLAHGGVSMFMEKNPIKFFNNFNMNKMCKDYEKSLDYMRKHNNVYVDLSAIISIFRSKIIKDLAENQKDIHNKLLFATDFPVPFSILFSFHTIPFKERLLLEKIVNPFDRYIAFLNYWFKEDSEIYTNYKKLIKE